MFDPKTLLDQLLGSKVPGMDGTVRDKAGQATQLAKDNPIATGAILAVLLGTGAGRAVTGTALRAGGLAAIAGLAYKAYQNYQGGQAPTAGQTEPELLPPPAGSGFDPAQAPQGETGFAMALVRVMIAAARADGHIDESERGRIADRLRLAGIGAEAEQFLVEELEKPVDLDALVAAAGTEPQKVELYTAARLTIAPDSRAERGFLDLLAGRLGLPDALVDHVEATVSSAGVPAASAAAPAMEPAKTRW